jgi:hypothetical protein
MMGGKSFLWWRLLSPMAVASAVLAIGGATTAPADASTAGRTFYVSPGGSDRMSGRSSKHPWRTTRRVNRARLRPGDHVLFRGGATFQGGLTPFHSGRPGAPIEYGSYGRGKARLPRGIWFEGASHLRFRDLAIRGAATAIQGTGDAIHVLRVAIAEVTIGINATGTDWTVERSRVRFTRDSGLILVGSNHTVTRCLITDTGRDPAITYGKHAIYVKVANARIIRNVVRRFQGGSAVSARYRDSVIERNTISGGEHGLSFFQQDSAAGTSLWSGNRISATTVDAVYVSAAAEAGPTRERFVISGNRFAPAMGPALRLDNDPLLNSLSGNLVITRAVRRR